MSLYDQRRKEFIETIKKIGNLPKLWEYRFIDGEDQRLWFNKLKSIPKFQELYSEVNKVLASFGRTIIPDKEKEQVLKDTVDKIGRMPTYNEFYFDDNEDMFTWYVNYIKDNRDFEKEVYSSLGEYQAFDLAEIWSDVKKEFLFDVKRLKRIPRHGDARLNETGIDISVIFSKLATFDQLYYERLLLHLASYKKHSLTPVDREKEFITFITNNKYVPVLGEARFSDGCDMFTWYRKYRTTNPDLAIQVTELTKKESPLKKVNIYAIPNFKKTGGKFYTICSNVGEELDLSEVTSFEEAKELYPTLTKRGGLILKKDEEFGSTPFKRSKK